MEDGKKKKDKRKRLVVALNLSEQAKKKLQKIAYFENRSVTQQIEFFLLDSLQHSHGHRVGTHRLKPSLSVHPTKKVSVF